MTQPGKRLLWFGSLYTGGLLAYLLFTALAHWVLGLLVRR
jgi:hypothetical protein